MRRHDTPRSQTVRAATRLVTLAALLVSGCGGMDESDIRRHAIKRPDREEQRAAARAEEQTAWQQPTATADVAPVAVVSAPAAAEPSDTAPSKDPAGGEQPSTTAQQAPSAEGGLGPIPDNLTAAGRLARTAKNMRRIADALRAYREDKGGSLPPQGAPRVSWRVELLPYLGYGELYKQYNKSEPWFSDHNKKLLEKIPSEYQSPERRDSRTNYLVVTGFGTVYGQTRLTRRLVNRAANTIVLVEANDDMAVNWTDPKDFAYERDEITSLVPGLGDLRGDTFLAITGACDLYWMENRRGIRKYFRFETDETGPSPSYDARDIELIEYALFEEQNAASVAGAGGSAATNEGGSTASAASPITGGTRGSSLATSLWQAVSPAARTGDVNASWRWVRGATSAGLGLSQWGKDFRWMPGLRRPSLGVQVAVASPGQPSREVPSEAVRREFIKRLGEAGPQLVMEVEEAAVRTLAPPLEGAFTLTTEVGRRGANRASPLLFITDALSASEAEEKAREAGVDVLVYVDVRTSSARGVEYEVTVYDVFRGRRMLKTPRVLVQSNNVSQDEIEQNRKELRWAVSDFFEDSLTPQPWPVQITPTLAQKRLETLANRSGRAMPLVALTEFQYYRQKSLIDDAELLQAAQGLLGREAGMDLVLGDETKQGRVMRQWLPHEDPAEYVAMAAAQEQQRRDRDDD